MAHPSPILEIAVFDVVDMALVMTSKTASVAKKGAGFTSINRTCYELAGQPLNPTEMLTVKP